MTTPQFTNNFLSITFLITLTVNTTAFCSAGKRYSEYGLKFRVPEGWHVLSTNTQGMLEIVPTTGDSKRKITVIHFSAPPAADHSGLHKKCISDLGQAWNGVMHEYATEPQKHPGGMTLTTEFRSSPDTPVEERIYLVSFYASKQLVVFLFRGSTQQKSQTVSAVLDSVRIVDEEARVRRLQAVATVLNAFTTTPYPSNGPASGSSSGLTGKWWTQGPGYLIFSSDGGVQKYLAGNDYVPRTGTYSLQGDTIVFDWRFSAALSLPAGRDSLPFRMNGDQFTIVDSGVAITYNREK